MRWLAVWIVSIAAGMVTPIIRAQADGGGRDLTILLFSTETVRAVTLTPLTNGAWTARCASCPHRPLTAPLRLATESGPDVYAGGTLRVVSESSHAERTAAGLWHLHRTPSGIDVRLTLPSEAYVAAVLNAEAAPDEPAESLQALAIVARSYALGPAHATATGRSNEPLAELTDSTQSQALRLSPPAAAVLAAVRETAGETLWFRGSRAQAYFSQHCGGTSEDAHTAGLAHVALPYLPQHADPYCLRRSPAAWHAEISAAELTGIARAQGWHLPVQVATIRVERTPSHRVRRIAISDGAHPAATLDAAALRLAVGRALGWNRIRSDLYDVTVRNGGLIFDGRGAGHGVGLCQVGAAEMAREHHAAHEILAFYFPGTTAGVTPQDSGWQTVRLGRVTVRTTTPLTPAQQQAVQEAWQTAQTRLPPAPSRAPQPVLTIAPSTELYRQLSAQPGWTLASTSGQQVTVQPLITLKAHAALQTTLLHELLHVLIEAEATPKAPLWLREGLAEALAGKISPEVRPVPIEAIDTTLRNPATRTESEAAHRAAAALVNRLIGQQGLTAVRGWLVSGVPASTHLP